MQCMAFGTPSLGDADFAFGYASSSNFPYSVEDKEILFRITNNRDIVGRVPPALAEVPHARQFLNKASVLNYSHIGTGVVGHHHWTQCIAHYRSSSSRTDASHTCKHLEEERAP